jgi:hypothetical protein
LRLFAAFLSFGSQHKGVKAALQPAKIKPGKYRSDCQTGGPFPLVCHSEDGGSGESKQKRKPGDAPLR